MKFRALFWWIDRWRRSSAYVAMTLAEQGAYRNLLDEATLRGGALPLDEKILAKACGDPRQWTRVRKAVLAHFDRRRDGWHHKTLDEVLRQAERRAINQQRYRHRSGHESDNGADNEPITRRSRSDNNADNEPDSPDPDPDPDPYVPPYPPKRGVRAPRRFTAKETQKAREWYRAMGRCPHGLSHTAAECQRFYIRHTLRLEPVEAESHA